MDTCFNVYMKTPEVGHAPMYAYMQCMHSCIHTCRQINDTGCTISSTMFTFTKHSMFYCFVPSQLVCRVYLFFSSQNYFGDPWNVLDFIIVVGSIIDIIAAKMMVTMCEF